MKPTTTAPPANAPRSNRMQETASLKAAMTPAQGTSRSKATRRTCPQCAATEDWGNNSWCPKCGFYPQLGTKVSADVLKSVGVDEEELGPAGPMPTWCKVMSAGLLAVIVVSIIARLRVPVDGPLTLWSLVQLGLGILLLIASHVQAFLVSGSGTGSLSMIDLLLSPLAVWKPVTRRLPQTGMLVARGAWGGATALCAILVVGGLNWENLSQLFVTESKGKKMNPLRMVMQVAGNGAGQGEGGGPESLDEAVQAFIDEVGVDGIQGGQAPVKPGPAMKSQCAIVGFTKDLKGGLHSVLLATMVSGKPEEFIAKLPVSELKPDIRAKLEAQLPELRSRRAYVPCPMQAHWVKPDLTCVIGYDPGEQDKKWKNLKFMEFVDPTQPEAPEDLSLPGVDQLPPEVEQGLPELQDALSR